MEKGKIRVTPKLMALLLAGGIALTPISGLAITDNSRNPGTFVKKVELDETKINGEYIVKEGDNLSRISEKICSHFRKEISTKYWPALAFLNDYPRVIREGDIIEYPKTFEQLETLNNKLEEIGWTSKYKQTYKVYGTKKKVRLSLEAVGAILADIYGNQTCVDPDFIDLYFKITGLDKKYKLSGHKDLSNDELADIESWIPTIQEINNYQEAHKTKVKK